MRIGLVIYDSLATVSGGYVYDREIVEHLRRQGDDVVVVSLPWRTYPRHLADNLSRTAFRLLADPTFDILLQDELNHPSLFVLNRLVRRRTRAPIVSVVHHLRASESHPAWLARGYALIERAYLRGVDGIVANSQTTLASVRRLMGKDLPAVVAYPAGDRLRPRVQPSAIQARAVEDGPLRLVFLGALIPRKGLDTLVAALAHLPRGACHLTVVGSHTADRAYACQVRQQVTALGLDDRVRFRGEIPDDDLRAVLEHGHVLVVPSSYEGFGIAYLEGMGLGLPAIGTTAGAAGEVIQAGRTGLLVPPGDPVALAGALERLHRDRDFLARLGQAALTQFQAHPAWDASATRVRTFLGEMHTGGRAP